MKLHAASAIFLVACFATLPGGVFAAGNNLNCKVGPIEKTYGASKWLIYSCQDRQTLVFVSAPGSKAFPFYFFRMKDKLHGEGTGDKMATDAAFAEISKIDDDAAAALLQATLTVGSQK